MQRAHRSGRPRSIDGPPRGFIRYRAWRSAPDVTGPAERGAILPARHPALHFDMHAAHRLYCLLVRHRPPTARRGAEGAARRAGGRERTARQLGTRKGTYLRLVGSLALTAFFLWLALVGAGRFAESGAGSIYALGVVVAAALLFYEHSLVKPGHLEKLNAAFFTMNGIISIAFFLCVLAERLLHGGEVLYARQIPGL